MRAGRAVIAAAAVISPLGWGAGALAQDTKGSASVQVVYPVDIAGFGAMELSDTSSPGEARGAAGEPLDVLSPALFEVGAPSSANYSLSTPEEPELLAQPGLRRFMARRLTLRPAGAGGPARRLWAIEGSLLAPPDLPPGFYRIFLPVTASYD